MKKKIKKPRLLKPKHPLPQPEQPTLIYHRFKASIENIIRFKQEEALSEERAKEDSLLNGLEEFEGNEEVIGYEEGKVRFKAKRELIRRILGELLDLRNDLKQELKRTLWEPPKWLTQHRVLKRLDKGRFRDVYGYLYNECVLRPHKKETKALIRRAGGRVWEGGDVPISGKDRQDAILGIDLGKMKKELEMSISALRKYLPALADAGVLKRLPNNLPRGEIVYSIGEYRGYSTKEGGWGYRVIPYLKEEKSIIEGLERMKLPRKREVH